MKQLLVANTKKAIADKIPLILLIGIIGIGFVYRLVNILQNVSYWNDENNVTIYARALIDHGKPLTASGYSTGLYQSAMYFVTALSFKLFGVTEFAGRLPSILVGTFLTIAVYFVTKKLFENNAALIAAFLTTFLQIQLAWSTQLRPYIWLQLFTVVIVYYSYKFAVNKTKFIDINFVIAAMLSVLAVLFHATALMNMFIIGLSVGYKALKQKKYIYLIGPIVLLFLIFAMVYSFSSNSIKGVTQLLLSYNTDILHYFVFITHNYLWLFAGASIGIYPTWRKNRELAYILSASISIIFFLAIFKINSQYVRYSLSAFPLVYILFGNGLVWLIKRTKTYIPLKQNNIFTSILILSIFFIFPLYKGKIVLLPQKYYSINADVRENPVPNYKSAFEKINTLIEGKKNIIIMDAWNDRVPWYLPNHKYIFLNGFKTNDIDPVFGEKQISTIKAFNKEKSKYRSGIVIVENWESQTPEYLKNYIKTTLKHEFDQGTVPGNEKDPWDISVYSWGL